MNLVPLAVGATVAQSALYDVPGGYRAVLFDRFSGVRPDVSGVYPYFKSLYGMHGCKR